MEYKRILTIQDISCLGQCSITVALPILSACGHETCILPTAVLSTHTGGFGRPVISDLSGSMEGTARHWKEQGILFDAIYCGYLGSSAAIRQAEAIMESLLVPGGLTVVDPAFGDNGKLYAGFDQAYVEDMKGLCRKADILIPNITEAAMLTGLPFETELTEAYIQALAVGLHHPCVVLTGAGCRPEETGILIREGEKTSLYRHPRIGRSCHGTGDIFASCFVGSLLRGKTLIQATEIAADMVCLSIRNTPEKHWYGVEFETALPELIRRLKED